ncbi:hypothetical protein KFV02_07360 [Desulfohalobiaceae bacterium Ax17]|uniref:hypothetical protein n=1 Tax=Desulfovulcanus ferrireducens TaxID=2831190 RepID=UPI00207BB8AE|nr:hypothetical protein [Desulfovulcanus ferrireducens]MBT8763748.1 hypothetical protein [Desulfovulcanus ferrireducens]
MDNKINLQNLEEAAFNAIDEIFSEEEKKDDNVVRLEEKILALDWEFSENDFFELREILNSLKQTYTDDINRTLLTMMDNIAKFVMTAKEKSPSNSLVVLAQIAKGFKEINFNNLNATQKKEKLGKIYKFFTQFKNDIIAKAKEENKASIQGKAYKKEITENKLENKKELFDYSQETALAFDKNIFKDYMKKLEKNINDINKKISDLEFNREIFSRLENLEEKIDTILSFIHKLNNNNSFATDIKTNIEEEYDENDIDKIDYEAQITTDDEDDNRIGEELIKDTENDGSEFKEDDIIPYVYVFHLDDKLVAFPYEAVLNIYSISNEKAKKLLSLEQFKLKNLKGFMKKLKKNMRGSLRRKKEKELKELVVFSKNISLATENTHYSNALLVECGDKYNIFFVGKELSSKAYLPISIEQKDENDIMGHVVIEGTKKAFLINPCQ